MSELFKQSQLEIKKLPIGLSLPFVSDVISFFKQTFTTEDKYKVAIVNLLMTTKGERKLVTTYGSNLRKRLFEQNSSDLLYKLKSDVESAFEEWLPEIVLVDLELFTDNSNEHSFLIKLFYKIPTDEVIKTLELKIN